jgi:hypothetical protein
MLIQLTGDTAAISRHAQNIETAQPGKYVIWPKEIAQMRVVMDENHDRRIVDRVPQRAVVKFRQPRLFPETAADP